MNRTALQIILALLICGTLKSLSEAQTINTSMVSFLNGKIGVRVGGGECAHMATEALRICGGEFCPADLGADSPSAGDYVWGQLVTVISYSRTWADSAPTVAVQPGDVIQYVGTVKIGTTTYPTRHTSVVKTVNTAAASRPTAVFQQNFGSARTVQSATIDVTKLVSGSLRIYRPISFKIATNVWKFTVVNNCTTTQSYTVVVGTSTVSSGSLTAANTAGSYRVHKVSTTGTVPALVCGTPYIYVQTAKGIQLSGSPTAVTQLSP